MPIKMARLELGVRLALKFYDAFNRHDAARMMQCMREDCLLESMEPAPDGHVLVGRAVVQQYWQGFFRASPDAHIQVEDVFGMGNRCVARWRYAWLDEDGRKRHLRGVDIFFIQEKLLSEQRSYVKGYPARAVASSDYHHPSISSS